MGIHTIALALAPELTTPVKAVAWAAAAVLALGGLATALTAIRVVVRGLVRFVRKVDRIATDILGEPERPEEGRERKPGLAERMTGVEQGVAKLRVQVDGIIHELHPNSGKSLRDAVDRIDKRTDPAVTAGGEGE